MPLETENDNQLADDGQHPVEANLEDESVPQSALSATEDTLAQAGRSRSPLWIGLFAGALLLAVLVWVWPRASTQPQTPQLANATLTATADLVVLVPTATPIATATHQQVGDPASTSAVISPAPTDTLPAISQQIDITDLLSSDIPVIDLPDLPNAIVNDPLPAVAAEGGKPIIIAALAAQQPLAFTGLSLEQFLSKKPRVLPAMGYIPSAAEAANLRKIPPTPTPIPVILTPGRSWVNFAPPSPAESDHFWVARQFGSGVTTQIGAPSYQFGSTGGGRYRVHHGMDIGNPFSTPVLAGATGEVVHAGLDDPVLLGPYNNFYGNAVVIRLERKLRVAGGELDVFLLYGHLSQVNVAVGQRVQPDNVIGAIGMTGIAIGPHLHVEMRVGANSYGQSVNPYLWVQPLSGTGAVAVRLLTADGRTWSTARLSLAQFIDNRAVWARVIEVYPDNESVNPDPTWGENGAMEAVPAGSYYIYGVVNGERVAANLTVNAGQTTFVELRTTQ